MTTYEPPFCEKTGKQHEAWNLEIKLDGWKRGVFCKDCGKRVRVKE